MEVVKGLIAIVIAIFEIAITFKNEVADPYSDLIIRTIFSTQLGGYILMFFIITIIVLLFKKYIRG